MTSNISALHTIYFCADSGSLEAGARYDKRTATMHANNFPYLDHHGFIAIAHRGGAGNWPENSMLAFESAVNLGYQYIETDAHITRDGVLLAFHDDELDRVTDKQGRIVDLNYGQVAGAKIDGREPVPRLEQVRGTWPKIKFNIDPKHDAVVDPLCDLLKRMNAVDRVCIGSFSGARLIRARRNLGPSLCTSMGPREVLRLRLASLGVPVGSFSAACAPVARRHYGIPSADSGMIRAAHKRGMQLHVWTIDDDREMERLIDLGVDGLMTDQPSRLKAVLQRRGLWSD